MPGDCYASAGRHLMDAWIADREQGMTLVHGRPTLTVEPFAEYGHAWIEFLVPMEKLGELTGKKCELVMVYDTESEGVFPRELYYRVGQIDPEKCFRYDIDQMRHWVLSTGHWGPWEGPEACGPVDDRNKA